MIVFLSTADTDLLAMRCAYAPRIEVAPPPAMPRLVLGNAAQDGDVERAAGALRGAAPGAAVAVLRLHGGRHARRVPCRRSAPSVRSGRYPARPQRGRGRRPRPGFAQQRPPEMVALAGQYLLHGGVENARSLLLALAGAFLGLDAVPDPLAQPEDGVYRPRRHPCHRGAPSPSVRQGRRHRPAPAPASSSTAPTC